MSTISPDFQPASRAAALTLVTAPAPESATAASAALASSAAMAATSPPSADGAETNIKLELRQDVAVLIKNLQSLQIQNLDLTRLSTIWEDQIKGLTVNTEASVLDNMTGELLIKLILQHFMFQALAARDLRICALSDITLQEQKRIAQQSADSELTKILHSLLAAQPLTRLTQCVVRATETYRRFAVLLAGNERPFVTINRAFPELASTLIQMGRLSEAKIILQMVTRWGFRLIRQEAADPMTQAWIDLFFHMTKSLPMKEIINTVPTLIAKNCNVSKNCSYIEKKVYSKLCSYFVKINRISEIDQIMKLLPPADAKGNVYSPDQQADRALEIITDLPSEKQSLALSYIAIQLAQAENVDRAVEVTQCILEEDIQHTTFTEILLILYKRRQFERADEVLCEARDTYLPFNQNTSLLAALIYQLFAQRNNEKAEELLNQMEKGDPYRELQRSKELPVKQLEERSRDCLEQIKIANKRAYWKSPALEDPDAKLDLEGH